MEQLERHTGKTARRRFCRFCFGAAILLTCLAFAAFALVGTFSTVAVEIGFSADNNEHVAFLPDSIIGNAALLLGAAALFLLLGRIKATPGLVRLATLGMLAVVIGLGLSWALSVHALPGADSRFILERAQALCRGNMELVRGTDYLFVFPFQLGFLAYAELFCRLFGQSGMLTAMAVANVLWVAAAYLGLTAITHRLFSDDTVTFFAVLLLALCWQPVFLSTFLYGFLPGLGLGVWGVYCLIRGLKGNRLSWLLGAGLLLGLAVLLKKNNLILLIAGCIGAVLHVIRQGKPRLLLGAAAIVLCGLLLPWGVQKGYEKRLDVSFGKGTPQSAWLVTGVSESSFCSGWFCSYTTTALKAQGFDREAANRQAWADFREELTKFSGRPRYLAAFFYHKITSQWNEPAFQSIWSSQAGAHSSRPAPWVESVYNGSLSRFLAGWFNGYVELIYAAFAAAMGALLLRLKRSGPGSPHAGQEPGSALLILPVAALGAVLYHGIFEAKAQYAIVYLPMLLPYAAWGLSLLKGIPTGRGQGRTR